jgi:hypothetical protein
LIFFRKLFKTYLYIHTYIQNILVVIVEVEFSVIDVVDSLDVAYVEFDVVVQSISERWCV